MTFRTFDAIRHSDDHAPPEYAITMISQTWRDRTIGKRVTRPDDGSDQLLKAIAEPMRRWLDTLPVDAAISGRQLSEVFAPELQGFPGFTMAFLKILYTMRRIGAFDGYFSRSTVKNRYGKPYVNFHRKKR